MLNSIYTDKERDLLRQLKTQKSLGDKIIDRALTGALASALLIGAYFGMLWATMIGITAGLLLVIIEDGRKTKQIAGSYVIIGACTLALSGAPGLVVLGSIAAYARLATSKTYKENVSDRFSDASILSTVKQITINSFLLASAAFLIAYGLRAAGLIGATTATRASRGAGFSLGVSQPIILGAAAYAEQTHHHSKAKDKIHEIHESARKRAAGPSVK